VSTAEDGLFGGIYGAGRTAEALTDAAWLQAMLDFEAALARVGAAVGRISEEAAEAIAGACRAERYDPAELRRETARHLTPAVGLVAALRAQVGEPHAEHVHLGATSQDVIDTAAMLVAKRAGEPLLDDLEAAVAAAAVGARRHVRTPMVGRTLLQQALPVSFGLVAAGWSHGLADAADGLRSVLAGLPVQLGGPVGSGPAGLAARVGVELGLAEPALPWHTARAPVAWLASALGIVAGALGKVARDVTLLSSQELGELREGGDPEAGASSTMPHKHNPVAAISVLACTKRTPGLVATILAAMESEQQRAAGAWQSEWGTLNELIGLTGSAAFWGRQLLGRLQVDSERMRENLAELAASGVSAAADPERALGAAGELIERAVRR
jgi:3-carboxy-cis,cis-muconate cycloisomerase